RDPDHTVLVDAQPRRIPDGSRSRRGPGRLSAAFNLHIDLRAPIEAPLFESARLSSHALQSMAHGHRLAVVPNQRNVFPSVMKRWRIVLASIPMLLLWAIVAIPFTLRTPDPSYAH